MNKTPERQKYTNLGRTQVLPGPFLFHILSFKKCNMQIGHFHIMLYGKAGLHCQIIQFLIVHEQHSNR